MAVYYTVPYGLSPKFSSGHPGSQEEKWNTFRNRKKRGAWVAQPVKPPTSAQVMIPWFMGLSPVLTSVLIAQSLEPALDSVSPSLSVLPLLMLSLSLSLCQKYINIKKKIFF